MLVRSGSTHHADEVPPNVPEKAPPMSDEIQTIILDSITGTQRAMAVGMPCREILRASICDGRCDQ
jgi:hypothetical protein